MGHRVHEFPTHSQPFPHPVRLKEKQSQDLPKGDGEEKIPGEEKEREVKSLSFAPSSTRAFQGDLVQWQLEWRPQPAPCVRPGQEPTARGWLWLAFVPLALLSLSQKELFPPQHRILRGQREGHPDSSGMPEGLGWIRGTPRTRGARGEDGGEEGGGGRRWVGGEEVRLCSPPPRTTQGPSGRGRGEAVEKAAGGRPSPSPG